MVINKNNFREVLISYLENELNEADKAQVAQYIREHEEAAFEWALLKQTRLAPEPAVMFPNKKMLYRREEEEQPKVIPLSSAGNSWIYRRITVVAAAAAVLAFAVLIYMGSGKKPAGLAVNSGNGLKNNVENITGPGPGTGSSDNGTGANTRPNTKGGKGAKGNLINPVLPKNDKTHKLKKDKTNPAIPDQEHKPSIIIVEHHGPEDQIALLNGIDNPYAIIDQMNARHVNVPVIKKETKDLAVQTQNDRSLAEMFYDFVNKVSVKKEHKNDKTYYALSIETDNIKINKTFKSLIEQ